MASDMFQAGISSKDWDFIDKNEEITTDEAQAVKAKGTLKINDYEMDVISEGAGKKYKGSDEELYNNQEDALKASYIHDRKIKDKELSDINVEDKDYQIWEVEQGIRLEPIYNIDD